MKSRILEFAEAESTLQEVCEVLNQLISNHGSIEIQAKEDAFESLCESILSQQLSTKAAATIIGRFRSELGDELIPDRVLNCADEKIRSCGVSWSKVKYLNSLAENFKMRESYYSGFEELSNESIVDRLVEIKGVGIWTAQMFLIFSLGRPDVFPIGDLGIRNAIHMHFPETKGMSNPQLMEFSERWSPFRTAASLHLWKSLGNK